MQNVYTPTTSSEHVQPTWSQDNGKGFSIAALVMAGVGFLVIPLLFGTIAAILAGIGLSKGEKLAKWAMVAAVVDLVWGAIAILMLLSELGAL